MAADNSPNPDRGTAQRETDDRDAQMLIEIDDDGTIHGAVSPEIREKFADHELFSAVYDGGCIRLQGVR